MVIGKFFEKLFGLDQLEFDKIVIKKEVIISIIDFARANYPREFIAFLQGTTKQKVLTITNLIYQPYDSSIKQASTKSFFNFASNIVGSVHSHPSINSRPSNTDLQSFNKRGVVHLIIDYPYRVQDIKAYDFKGNRINFLIS